MIRGIGNDIIEIERIRRAMDKRTRFLGRFFTDKEQEYLKSRKNMAQSVAGRFAAKEAVAKALGTGFRHFGMADIEIGVGTDGKPEVLLSEKLKKALGLGETLKVMVTISHCKDYAMATAIAVEEMG